MRTPKIFTTIQTYTWPLFLADLLAGATVAMIALPLSLAIAIASGTDPAKGLVTAIVAGFVISLLGGSRVQIGGPTGAFIVVIFGVIAQHGYDGLVLATLMAGFILLIAGYFRAGNLIAFVPEAVVNGFTIGIGIILATSQLKDVLGIALVTLVLILFLRRIAPRFPGLIVAVGVGSALVAVMALPVDTLGSRFGELPDHLPWPQLPDLSISRLVELFPSALVIAFLAGVESLLSAMVADKMIAGHHRPNAELTAQGVANITSALFMGLPATGAIARTATNIKAGGKTPVAGIVHAVVIYLTMLVAAPLAAYLAMPALAAILIATAWNMTEPHKWREHLNARVSDKVLLVITLVLTVVVDLTVAIGVGVSLGLAIRLSRRKSVESDWTMPKR